MHATSTERAAALAEIALRCKAQRPDLFALLTLAGDVAPPAQVRRTGIDRMERLTAEAGTARQFLADWAPDICLWAGLPLLPTLLHKAAATGMPMILVDVTREETATLRGVWRGSPRGALGLFDPIFAPGTADAEALRRILRHPDRVEVTAPLAAGVTPPACLDSDFDKVSRQLAGRPLWLTAWTEPSEFETIVAAQRAIVRLSHRLLLVAHVAQPETADAMIETITAAGLRAAAWQPGAAIEDNMQALVCDYEEDLGLWYRAAPVTFVAGSLTTRRGGHCPLAAAALGSAVLHGPNVRNHAASYARLDRVGAALTVRGAEDLAAAVIRLSAPDQAAAMALAGWTIATEGAALSDRIVDIVQARLDARA